MTAGNHAVPWRHRVVPMRGHFPPESKGHLMTDSRLRVRAWEDRYRQGSTGWDRGGLSPALRR